MGINAWAVGVAVIAVFRPFAEDGIDEISGMGLLASFAFHAAASYVLGSLREE